MPNSITENLKNSEAPINSESPFSRLDMADDFLLYLDVKNLSPKTVHDYKNDLAIFNNFLISRNLKIQDLNKRSIFEFQAYLTSDNRETALTRSKATQRLNYASVNRCLSAVRTYIKFLIKQDYPTPIVPDQIDLIKKEKPHPHVAELNDLVALIESPSKLEKDPLIAVRNRAILETLFSTGMRISELVSLNKRDINEEGRIFIKGKGRKERFVYLTDRAKFSIDQYLAMRDDKQQALFVPTRTRSKDKLNSRLTPRYVEERMKIYREKLRLDLPSSPHSLRHGFATYMAENGASVAAIQILLGHESLNTTNRYISASDRFAQETHRKYHPLAKKE